jgi:hypothetical protein
MRNCLWCNATYDSGYGSYCSLRCDSEHDAQWQKERRERTLQIQAAEAERRRQLKAKGMTDAQIDAHDRQVALEQARAQALQEAEKQRKRDERDRKWQAREEANARRGKAALIFGGIPGGFIFLTSVGDKYLHGGWFTNNNISGTVLFFLFGALIGSVIAIMLINTLLGPVKDE